MGISRRTLLKGGASASAVALGIPFLSDGAEAWDYIETDVGCPSCEELVKFEQIEGDDPYFEVAEDWGVIDDSGDYAVDGDVYTLQPDDADVDARIELTPTETESDGGTSEIREIEFASDALVCEVKVKDGHNTDPHYYYGNRDLPVVYGRGLHVDDDSGSLKGISNLKFYYCPTVEVATVNGGIDITEDAVRFGIWWGPYHRDDQVVYDNGADPDDRTMSGSDYIFAFDSPYGDAFIDDPLEVNDPAETKAEFLVDPADNDDQGYVSEIDIPPGESGDYEE